MTPTPDRLRQPRTEADSLRIAVGRYIVAMTRRASGGTTDDELQAAYEAMYALAASPVPAPTLDVAERAAAKLLREADWFGPPGVYPLMPEKWDAAVASVARIIVRAALATPDTETT